MRTPQLRRLTVLPLIVLLLVLAPLQVQAEKNVPGTGSLVLLPPGSETIAAPLNRTALAPAVPPVLQDELAQLAAAQVAGDRGRLDAAAGNPDIDLTTRTARVILEMAVPPETHLVPVPTAEVMQPQGQSTTIEASPQVAIEADLSAEIAGAGATYETAYGNWVQVSAPFGSLTALAEIPGVTYVRLPFPAEPTSLPARNVMAPAAPLVGAQTSEGVAVSGVDNWHAAGYTGSGVSLAVFDFGFTGWAARQAAGDLPPGGRLVLKDFSASYSFNPDTAGFVHGTACGEIAYDMAPGATVYLYAFNTETELGNAVSDFINNVGGKKVVTMSIGWVNAGPYDGTGSINTIVDGARNAGIFWANSAGNSQKTHYSGLSAQYNTTDAVAFGAGNVQGYGPSSGSLWNVSAGAAITAFLEWNDWNASRTGNQAHKDYDLELYRYSGGTWVFVTGSYGNQCTSTAPPTEAISYTAPATGDYALLIMRYEGSGACPNSFGHWLTLHSFLSAGANNLFWYVNGCNSMTIPADGDSAVAVGAAFWNEDAISPLYGLEPFSSCGPRNSAGGAQPSATIDKVDVVGIDGVTTATYGASNGVAYANSGAGFWGSSAASPHVGGLAATAWSARPDLTLAQLRSSVAAHAVPEGDGGTCGATGGQNSRFGWGRIAPGTLPVAGLWDGGGATNNWTEAANWDSGTVPVAGVPVLFNATSTKNATVNGSITAASLTLDAGYTGAVTLGGNLAVGGDLVLNSGSLDVSAGNYPISIGGNFLRTGGTFTPLSGTVTFGGSGTKTITGDTSFFNLVVGGSLTLATTSNVSVAGTLTNSGLTQETKAIGGAGALSFGLANIGVNVATVGSLSSLQVARRDQSYSGAPLPVQTGKYWTLTPSGSGYTVSLTLPHSGLADPSVCRNMGGWWDCARSSFGPADVTRAGVTAFSDWAVGSSVSAPAVPSPVSISRSNGKDMLTWSHLAANARGYEVWWSSEPYFVPGAPGSDHAVVTVAPWQYEHAGTPGVNYYYIVLGVNSVGAKSGNSTRTGHFEYGLAPGGQ